MSQLKKKSSLCFFTGLTCFTWASSFCFSLPSVPVAQSGTVQVEYPNSHTMVIKPSNDAILQYEDFYVGSGEEVRFIQKTSSSVQHRVIGGNSSQILGSIHSSGKVVLINANGISFGSDSKVHAGSLILSTLDMMDPSHFALRSEGNSSIALKGSLRSEGSIVLLAPHIRNLGSIEAYNVLLGAGKHIALDGANLSVSGSLKEGLIEQLGNIKATTVSMKLPLDTKLIVERDETHQLVIEENGIVTFGSVSQIKAQKLHVEASQISIQGSIDSTNALDKGGGIHLFGKDISLEGSRIDVSGLLGGGEVLIGGEFQGKGKAPYASKIIMDESSEIYANSKENGNGGLVVLWSQDQTLFDGHIESQGGVLGGDGGLVETSSQGNLDVRKGTVNTLATNGQTGEWLLDPTYIDIVSGDYFDYGYGEVCPTNTVFMASLGTDKFKNLSTDVTVQVWEGITIYDSINVTGSNGGKPPNVTFKTCQGGYVSVGDPSHCDKNVNITTNGGSLKIDNVSLFYLQCQSTTITTNGGDIDLANIGQMNTCYSTPPALIIEAKSGTVTFSTAMTALNPSWPYLQGSITVNSAGLVKTAGLFINGALKMKDIPIQVLAGGSGVINTNEHDITIGNIDAASGASSSLSIIAGLSNTITIGAVGSANPLASFSIPSDGASSVSLSNVTTKGAISILSPATFSSSSMLTSNGGTISLGSAITSGTVTADGDIDFAVNSTINGTFKAGKSISFTDSLILGGTSKLTASDGITIGAQISSNGSPNYDLTLDAGSSPISIGGGISNIHSFTIKNAGSVSLFDIGTIGGPISITSPTVTKAPGTINSQGGDVTFSGTILPRDNDIGGSLVIYAVGAINLQGLGDSTHYFGDISLTGSAITLGSNINASGTVAIANTSLLMIPTGTMTVGGFTQTGTGTVSLATSIVSTGLISFEGALTIIGATTLQGSKGISIPSSITPNSVDCNLTLNAGSNPMTIKSLGSTAMPFGALSITASMLDLGGDVYSSSSIKIDSPITISTSTKITSADAIGLTLTKPVTVAAGSLAPTLTLNATSSGPIDVNSLGSDEAPLGAISLIGNHVYLSGDIASSASVGISGPVTILAPVTLTGDRGISLDQDLVSGADPFDLGLIASNGTVSIKNLGTDLVPLGSIAIASTGSIETGNLISAGNITITNTGLLTISSGSVSLSGNFTQNGTGAVSLGTSIETQGSISFTGALTITADTTLQGFTGITITSSISPQSNTPNLILDAGTTPLTVTFLSSETNSFGSVTVSASSLILGGDVYASSSIKINPSIAISANTTLDSLEGTGGIVLLKPVTAATGSVAPTLTLSAAGGAADVNSLGSSDAPLGAVSLKGSSVFFSGNVTSTGLLNITGPIYLLNDESISLTGDAGIALDNDLVPNAGSCDLIMQSTGIVTTQNLGSSSYPLNDVFLTASSIQLQGTITAKSLEINCETCSSGICPPGTYTTCPSLSSEKQSR
ncbi:MAG: filamentous hemagglutinin N-terminal domain-containing protein [Rhabdochlamydiaceae bacterium]|nr:filamentous hemagglutinin N-terminal domain-containing protein [Rhabdochlamydiaceae bacterium]